LNYLEFTFTITPAIPGSDLLISELAETGFESFEETETGCKAWIPAENYEEAVFDGMEILHHPDFQVDFKVEMIAGKNWNAEWEQHFDPVIVGDCIIRAPFHKANKQFRHEVIILPQMSFGTGHHETTSLMVGKLLTVPVKGLDVLDMGCGTGVLAILAAKLGAARVVAIDYDANAVENTLENCTLNKREDILVHKGDAALLRGKLFHVIFANINRNVLLADMETYVSSLQSGGRILISGFFRTDIPQLLECGLKCGLILNGEETKNEWALMDFTKN
jgi:ribosomal protein L11 methyltransferase